MATDPAVWPDAVYLPGADAGLNDSRRQAVRGGIIHTAEGRGDGLIALMRQRRHSTPGTFNSLVMEDGRRYTAYPANVRCTHAAGANLFGDGVELEGFTGQPRPRAQLESLGMWVRWHGRMFGTPGVLKADDPRVWLDRADYRGFSNHRGVDYPPDTSLRHYNGITRAEWAIVTGFEEDDTVNIDAVLPMLLRSTDNADLGRWWVCSPISQTRTYVKDYDAVAFEMAAQNLRGWNGGPIPVPQTMLDRYKVIVAPPAGR